MKIQRPRRRRKSPQTETGHRLPLNPQWWREGQLSCEEVAEAERAFVAVVLVVVLVALLLVVVAVVVVHVVVVAVPALALELAALSPHPFVVESPFPAPSFVAGLLGCRQTSVMTAAGGWWW